MLLSVEQRMARDTAREFARRELAPHSAEWDRTATFPRAALKALGQLGFMGGTVPPEWDGAGLDYVSYALALEERACAFVVPRAGERPTFEDLTALLAKEGMAKNDWPERVEPVEAMPRTPSGKIQKFKLREAAARLGTV